MEVDTDLQLVPGVGSDGVTIGEEQVLYGVIRHRPHTLDVRYHWLKVRLVISYTRILLFEGSEVFLHLFNLLCEGWFRQNLKQAKNKLAGSQSTSLINRRIHEN